MHYLWTGQRRCFGPAGQDMPCATSGQDAETRPGLPWPDPRFEIAGQTVRDAATGLVWSLSANPLGFPLPWAEALTEVARLNAAGHLGRHDWRLPNRRELRSLVDHAARDPALPAGHPFQDVFGGWAWTSTTAALAPAYAWRVQLAGGRMFYGAKTDGGIVWPVAGESPVLPATGQRRCYGVDGAVLECAGGLPGQDGELLHGVPWPEPRFMLQGDMVRDELTGLTWSRSADLASGPVDWATALAMARRVGPGFRLPSINELESLVDADRHSPALPAGHPFEQVPEALWSSSTSGYDPAWAFCLYLHKGAVGVGFKALAEFSVWAVRAG